MLWNPKWEVEIKANPLTLEGLIAWLEKQPADASYDYQNCRGGCLYGRYMASHGIKWEESGGVGYVGQKRDDFRRLVYDEVAFDRPWTFGAALERARKAAGS